MHGHSAKIAEFASTTTYDEIASLLFDNGSTTFWTPLYSLFHIPFALDIFTQVIEEGPTAVSVELLARLVGVPWNVVTKALLSAAMVTLDYRCTV